MPSRALLPLVLLLLATTATSTACRKTRAGDEAQPAADDAAAGEPLGDETTSNARAAEPDAATTAVESDTADPPPHPLVGAALRGSVLAGVPAAQQPEVVFLEPRTLAAGPCGVWPDALEPVEGSARRKLDEVLPDGALVAAVRADRATVQTRALGPHKVRVVYSAGPDCEFERSRSTTAATPPGLPPEAVDTTRPGTLPDADVPGTPPDEQPTEWYLADIELRDLQPATRYRYRVVVDGQGEGPWGTFTTAPVDDRPVRIGFVADLFQRDDFLDLLPQVQASAPDVLVALGDWPYADAAPPARTLDEFRIKHAESRGLPAVQDLMRTAGVLAMWDDHEVTNDWDGRDAEREPRLVAAGVHAWHERFPTRDVPEAGREHQANHRKVAWGPGLDLFLLDTRSFRDRNSRTDDADKRMLGAEQLAWLEQALRESTATFKVIVSSVPLVQATTRDDSWAGFRTERDALMDFVVDEGLEGVVVMSGDQHWLAVHHTRWGIQEFQIGPTAAFLRAPRPSPPRWVKHQREILNYGLLDYLPATDGRGARLRFTAVGPDQKILWQEAVHQHHGRVEVSTASTQVGWRLEGPHTFEGTGSVSLDRVPVGRYTLTWLARVPGTGELPAPSTVEVERGETVTVRSRATPAIAPLLYDGFDALSAVPDPVSWRAVDEGRHGTPSRWQRIGDTIAQLAPVRDVKELPEARDSTSARDLLREGTWLLAEDVSLGDMVLEVDVFAGDEDGWGVMWAVDTSGESAHYLRVDFDRARGGWRFVEVVDGAARLLAEDLAFAVPGPQWVHLRIERRGASHAVVLDQKTLFKMDVATAPEAGSIALWSWSMTDVRFDDLVVLP